jgi:hypothetical protein
MFIDLCGDQIISRDENNQGESINLCVESARIRSLRVCLSLILIFNSRPYISWPKPYNNNNLRFIFWVSHFSHATYIMLVDYFNLFEQFPFIYQGRSVNQATSHQSEIPFHAGMQLYNRCYGKQRINCQTHRRNYKRIMHLSLIRYINKEKETRRGRTMSVNCGVRERKRNKARRRRQRVNILAAGINPKASERALKSPSGMLRRDGSACVGLGLRLRAALGVGRNSCSTSRCALSGHGQVS